MARAVLEGIALRIQDILEGVEKDAKTTITEIMTDGGVSRSDILMQCLADYSGCQVERGPRTGYDRHRGRLHGRPFLRVLG